MKDVIMVGFEEDPKGIDITVLNVMRVRSNGMQSVNTLFGQQAKEIYKVLTTQVKNETLF